MSTMYPTETGAMVDSAPHRTSILAITSLVLGILSIFACPVQVVGPLAIFVGVFALVAISRAQGSLAGKGLAIGGMVTGLVGLVMSLLFLFGTVFVVGQIGRYGQVVGSAQALDEPAVAAITSANASGVVDAETLKTFDDATTAALGDFERVTPGIGAFFMSFTKITRLNATVLQQYQAKGLSPIPMAADFANGPATLVMIVNQNEQGGDLPFGKLVNLAVIPEGSTQVIWLFDPTGSGASNPTPLPPVTAPGPLTAPTTPTTPADPK
ncbi:MAG: DUF4190 domain-containing protein [bacterium]|nr:DUF4190 domain-containing protein [bacterium]